MAETEGKTGLSERLKALQRRIAELESTGEKLRGEVSRQKVLAEQTAIFRKFAETSSQALGMGALDGGITWSNASLARILGYDNPEGPVGTNVSEYYLEEDKVVLQNEILPKVIERGMYTVEMPLVSRDGRVTPCIQAVFLIRDKNDDPLCYANVITDLSERRKAEDALRRAHDELERRVEERTKELRQEVAERTRAEDTVREYSEFNEKMFAASSVGIGTYRSDGQCVLANEALARILGATRDQVLSQNILKLETWKKSGLLADATEVFATGVQKRRDIHVTTTFGKTVWLEIRFNRFTSGGEPHLLLMVNDISERKNVEKALRESEENLAITLNSIGDAVIATDADGNVTRMNPVAEGLTGWPATQAVGRSLDEVFRVVRADTKETVGGQVDVQREREIAGLAGDTILIARDGTERKIANSGAQIRGENAQVFGRVFVFRDITEEQALLEQLRQSQKMEAVGQLAGGVAHDFNNLLTAIIGNAQLLVVELDPQRKESQYAEDIVKASSRAAELTQQLLAFSRSGRLQTADVDMHQVIHEVVELMRRSIDKRVEIVEKLEASPSTVHGDRTQLQNAILNLGVNARDAMPDGGALTFATRSAVFDDEHGEFKPLELAPGAYLEIEVTDTGVGMEPELQKRIFEPFFTTKETGQGTGLGLAGVYGCVKNHDGAIKVDSKPGKGATFRVLLPLVESAAPAAPVESSRALIRGDGHILVVDDEETVRNVTANALRELGYSVSLCADGVEAVDFFRKHHGDVDLVILDLIMPRLSGEHVFRLMIDIDPSARVLIASAFSLGRTVNALLEQGAVGFLKKPFRIEEVSREVAKNIKTKI
jgi:PAS domain S-box-containing protein